MPATKTLNTRIIHKHDTAENWGKAENFIPNKGELIVYDIDTDYDYERFKIGDGIHSVNELPFADDDLRKNVENKVDKLDIITEAEIDEICENSILGSGEVDY